MTAAWRMCAWCREPKIRPAARRDTKTCSQFCRQAMARFVKAVPPARRDGSIERRTKPMVFAYADPPYVGKSRRYYKREEVDHEALVVKLMQPWVLPFVDRRTGKIEIPTSRPLDGWALSCSSESLQALLAICPAGVRVASWMKGARPGKAIRPRSSWEPVIVYGGRPRLEGVAQDLTDSLVLPVSSRSRTHPGALTGMKPPGFCRWLFDQLGADAGDALFDLYPGSGAVMRAWHLFTGRPS